MASIVHPTETVVEVLPALYANNSHGREKVWMSRILTNTEGHGIYEIEHGQYGGKLQLTRRVVLEGKNLGKKNETTPLEQCTSELHKKWKDKQNKEGYATKRTDESTAAAAARQTNAAAGELPEIALSGRRGSCASSESAVAAPATAKLPSVSGANMVIYPMLAQTYKTDKAKQRKNGIVYPCYVQPKLDGLRCLVYISPASGEIVTQSRTGGFFEHLKHVKEAAAPILRKSPRIVLDGELYTTEIPFENLAGIIKKKKVDAADLALIARIGYHVYDCVLLDDLDATYERRMIQLNRLLNDSGVSSISAAVAQTPQTIHIVQTHLVETPEEFYRKFQEYTMAGYEGAMLRNHAGPYKQNYRSNDLQKYKEFQEDEYEIVGYTQGDGRDEGTVIWICRTPAGREFNVRPKGTVEFRRELFENAAQYVGQKLTVIFQELTDWGVPRFPVGKSVRID